MLLPQADAQLAGKLSPTMLDELVEHRDAQLGIVRQTAARDVARAYHCIDIVNDADLGVAIDIGPGGIGEVEDVHSRRIDGTQRAHHAVLMKVECIVPTSAWLVGRRCGHHQNLQARGSAHRGGEVAADLVTDEILILDIDVVPGIADRPRIRLAIAEFPGGEVVAIRKIEWYRRGPRCRHPVRCMYWKGTKQ